MSTPKKSLPPIGGTIILVIFLTMVLLVVLAFFDAGPLTSLKTGVREWAQNMQEQVRQAVGESQSVPAVTSPQGASVPGNIASQTQTIGNWEYTLKSIQWNENTIVLNISIRNTGGQDLPFGFSYQVSDESFNTVYKLCAQNSSKQVFWDTSLNGDGTGFYNRHFSAGETKTGTLMFKVAPDSEKIYLCLSIGGNVANKLFYLGSPK